MSPKVSVVIKSYNHAKFVAQSIRSILDQSFQDFEIVITDDGSTDGTPEIIRQLDDPRINLQVSPTNRGISNAMNATIARSRGEFIAILNSDDFALPGRLERQVRFLETNPGIGAVFGMPQPVDDQGQPTRSFYDFSVPFSLPDLSRASLLRQFFFFSNCLCAPTAMVRRAVYDEVGAYDPRLTNLQDLDMWIRVCANHDIHIMRDQLTAFRIRADLANTSAPRPDTILRCQFETTQILKRYLTLDRKFLAQILGHDLAEHGISLERPTYHWLAELALVAGSMAHKVFALETLFESARTDADCFRIRDLAGELDLFGIESKAVIPKLEADVAEMHKRIHQMELEAEVHHSRFSSSETSLKGE